jgi:OPA family sugar phosphate sensor protein UhpC-like MFS transporter
VSSNNQDIAAYRPWQIKILIATWLAYAGYYFCRKPFYIAKVSISSAMGLSAFDLAQIGTAYLVAYTAGQFSSAFFGRKMGPRILLLAGMGISVISGVMFGISDSYWMFMLFIGLNGLAQGTGWPGCIGSLAFWFRRKQRGSVLGIWSTCYQLGPIAATVLASFLLGRAGWRWSFFGGSIVLLAIWFIVLLLHPDRPENAGLPSLVDDEDEMQKPSSVANESAWNRNIIVTIAMMGLIYFCIKFLRYALWSWLPWFLNKNFTMTETNAGYLSIIFDICGFAGVITGGFLSDRLFHGRRAVLSFIMLGWMTLSFVILYLLGSKNILVFTISIGVAGFMLFGPDSLLSGVGAIDVGSKQGALAAAGVINGMGSIGTIFQEQLIGWLYQRYDRDLVPILVMLVFISCLSTLLAYLLLKRSKMGLANI